MLETMVFDDEEMKADNSKIKTLSFSFGVEIALDSAASKEKSTNDKFKSKGFVEINWLKSVKILIKTSTHSHGSIGFKLTNGYNVSWINCGKFGS